MRSLLVATSPESRTGTGRHIPGLQSQKRVLIVRRPRTPQTRTRIKRAPEWTDMRVGTAQASPTFPDPLRSRAFIYSKRPGVVKPVYPSFSARPDKSGGEQHILPPVQHMHVHVEAIPVGTAQGPGAMLLAGMEVPDILISICEGASPLTMPHVILPLPDVPGAILEFRPGCCTSQMCLPADKI